MVLTAVGICVAIAVMLWISGLVRFFTNYEEIEASLKECRLDGDSFKISARLKNIGESPAQVGIVSVNGVPLGNIEGAVLTWFSEKGESGNGAPIPLGTGVNVDVELTLPYGARCGSGVLTSGVTISLSFRSSSNVDYKISVQLP